MTESSQSPPLSAEVAEPRSEGAPAHSRSFLSFLSRWDSDESAVLEAIGALAGRPVEFSGRPPPEDAGGLFALFERDPLGAVSQRDDGSWVLPYNPWVAYRRIVEERYLPPSSAPLHSRLPFDYHRIPGWLRLALYPLVAGKSVPPEADPSNPSPKWPTEPRVDAYRADLFRQLASHRPQENSEGPWPGGARFPLLMTHDIDTAEGMKLAGSVLDDMVDIGLKPCFFLVAHGYTWDEGFCDAVRQAGGEIGLHGDTHDNRIAYEPPARIAERLDSCRDKVERHEIKGFRSPSLLVSDDLYTEVGRRFAWDSSVPDTDTGTLLGPRRGCATVFPFRRQGCLVLPTTMPADDRLLLLGHKGLDLLGILRRKALYLREISGPCHFLTHPEPHLFGRPILRDVYRALIEELLDGGDAWVATPSELSDYWRAAEDGRPASSWNTSTTIGS
jgi:peptidoglycan/xylan/chitin deacetylase (PgdA/CDA1 family)